MLGVEVGSDGPALRAIGWLGEHQGASVEEQDMPGIDGGEALAWPELYGAESGGECLKVSAGEVIEVVGARGPDASRRVLMDVDEHALLETVGFAKTVELRAVIAEESVFGGGPEKAGLILHELEDIVVLQALLLFVVLKGKPLGAGIDCRDVD